MTQQARRLVRLANDFNRTEDEWSIVLNPAYTPPEVLVPGTRVFLYETSQLEGLGIVQRGKIYPWVAQMIVETTASDPSPASDVKLVHACGTTSKTSAPISTRSTARHASDCE